MWHQSNDGSLIVMDMAEYVKTVERPKALKARMPIAMELSSVELTAYRSLLMKLAWPVRHVLPQFAYQVSVLAAYSAKATGEHVRKLHALYRAVMATAEEDRACIAFNLSTWMLCRLLPSWMPRSARKRTVAYKLVC